MINIFSKTFPKSSGESASLPPYSGRPCFGPYLGQRTLASGETGASDVSARELFWEISFPFYVFILKLADALFHQSWWSGACAMGGSATCEEPCKRRYKR